MNTKYKKNVASLQKLIRMYRIIICCLLLLLAFVGDVPLAKAQGQDGKWELVFSDEFNQPDGSQPDNTKWSPCKRYKSTAWNRWISENKDVAYINKRCLVCRAIPNKSLETDTAKMLTGAIESRGKFSFKYGKVEVRMKTGKRRGNFPAVWMKPDKYDSNKYGEIDIVEMYGDLGVAEQTVHSHQTVVLKRKGKNNSIRTKVNVSKWHVYGMEWTTNEIIFTIDGRVTARYPKSRDLQDIKEGQWTFDRPFFLIMNQSVGNGNHEAMVPNTSKVYETQFDWIRVYRIRE